MRKFKDGPGDDSWETRADREARSFAPPIRQCQKCGEPYVSGYCCPACGDSSPYSAPACAEGETPTPESKLVP